MSRSRLPLPPVPAAARPTGQGAPRTTAAPFRAVPKPEPRVEVPAPVPAAVGAPLDRAGRAGGAPVPAIPRPARSWQDDESALVSTGPSVSAGARPPAPRPSVPRQAAVLGAPSPAYGDWTKPGTGDVALAPDLDLESPTPSRLRLPPATTAIPERSVAGRRQRAADGPVDDAPDRSPAEPPSRGHGTGPVVGGRAAFRAERQAADAARRKAEKQRGGRRPAGVDDEDGDTRRPRRVIKGLVAMTVVALAVLGVYSFASPDTQDAAAQTPAAPSTSQPAAAPSQPLPALPSEPVTVETPAAPVRVPVTVLNATDINGLAAKISGAVVAAGWESPGVAAYPGGDVAASTVFFTEGDETQRQAAVQLVDQFPQLQGPAPRFFELPADVTAPGLVIVATGDWQP